MKKEGQRSFLEFLLIALGFSLGITLGVVVKGFFADKLTADVATLVGSFLGAIVGFVGLLVGTIYNAEITRKRDLDTRENEVISICNALLSEIKIMTNHLDLIIESSTMMENTKLSGKFQGKSMDFLVYNNIVSKLGLLGPELSHDIVWFYGGRWSIDHITNNDGITKENAKSIREDAERNREDGKKLQMKLNNRISSQL